MHVNTEKINCIRAHQIYVENLIIQRKTIIGKIRPIHYNQIDIIILNFISKSLITQLVDTSTFWYVHDI